MSPPTVDWNTGDKSALVSIGTHKLYLSVSGPDRKPGEPIVLLMQGLGSTIDEWVVVKRHVTPFARWLAYDRSGQARSEDPPSKPEATSAVSVATELDTLLTNAGVEGPFIIVCHSWGGITAREFFHIRQKDVVGMVFVDANTEKTHTEDTLAAGEWPPPYFEAVVANVDYMAATGIAADCALSEDEKTIVAKQGEDPREQATSAAEQKGYPGDPPVLAAKKHFEQMILRDRPISVIRANTPRDFQRLYDAGVALGNGNEEEREQFRRFLATFPEDDQKTQEEILTLSTVSHYVRAASGHNVQMVQPELIAEEVRWVWDRVV
ncbi:alpha/beta-hydrolase [Hyaloscypha hepaticicola]|uniref:Alpha/beta-hydrolase n=1 Tax=Hyaloscypha hepaticicola TaxID=2082293 RepID=A0A2J6Q926_9HELO|nr:alpha/beta-hydrolase [Hyaloscypha hepaticicola]